MILPAWTVLASFWSASWCQDIPEHPLIKTYSNPEDQKAADFIMESEESIRKASEMARFADWDYEVNMNNDTKSDQRKYMVICLKTRSHRAY